MQDPGYYPPPTQGYQPPMPPQPVAAPVYVQPQPQPQIVVQPVYQVSPVVVNHNYQYEEAKRRQQEEDECCLLATCTLIFCCCCRIFLGS